MDVCGMCCSIFNTVKYLLLDLRFESSVKSDDTKTSQATRRRGLKFESSVKSDDTKTWSLFHLWSFWFESSVKSDDTKTIR